MFDLIVIGAGAGGLTSAAGAAKLGARVALVERTGRLGGDCLWTGCVPSKTLLKAARVAHIARSVHRFGIKTGPVEVDFPAVMKRVHEVREHIETETDNADRFRRLGVDVVFGPAVFRSPEEIDVAGRRLQARSFIIASGARAALPGVPGLAAARPLTNETLFELEQLPASLAILGGGPVGCEMGQAFHRLGSRVTLFQRNPRLTPRMDPEISAGLEAALRSEGLDIHTGSAVVRVETLGPRTVVVAESPAGPVRREVDAVLVAAGRTPNIETLGLERLGIDFDNTGIHVDSSMRTNLPHVFAVGDVVAGAPQFTHAASAAARVALSNALLKTSRTFDFSRVPHAVFTEPEAAGFGATEPELQSRETPHTVARARFAANDRALCEGETEGLVKLLLSPVGGKILGVHILGSQAGELIHEWSTAAAAGLSASAVSGSIHVYPTLSGSSARAADEFLGAKLFDTPAIGIVAQILRCFRD